MDLPDKMPEHDMIMSVEQAGSMEEALTNAYMRGFYDGYSKKEENK